jgi:hypothetical protein
MRRPLALGAVTGAALVTAGIAAATLGFSGTQTVTATFGASRDRADVKTCTGTDGTYEIVKGRYAGEADSSIAGLDGPLRIDVTSTYKTTEKVGWMTASVRVRRTGGSDDRDFVGRLTGTLTGGSGDARVLDGFLAGRIGGRYADVVGNVTASFTASGGFTGGKLGEGGANTALMIGRSCVKQGPTSVQLVVKGTIESLSSTSISVKPRDGSSTQTCAVKAGTSPSTSRFEKGDGVEMRCGLVSGEMTLLKLSRNGKGR